MKLLVSISSLYIYKHDLLMIEIIYIVKQTMTHSLYNKNNNKFNNNFYIYKYK